jgi:hypothetical protein
MGLVPRRVRAFIGVMSGLSTIVANAGRKFFSLGSLLMCLPLAWGRGLKDRMATREGGRE